MWGGGKFTAHTKVLPGAYHNVVSAARASINLSARGFAAMPLTLDWGVDGKVFKVTSEDLLYSAKQLFGYEYGHEKMVGIREFFKHGHTLYVYKLNSDGTKASNTYAEAKCSGLRGNALKIVVAINVDDETKYDVKTYLDTLLVDSQTVASAKELVDNDFVTFKKEATLSETANTPLTGGTNGTEESGTQWEAALKALESYSFNVLGVASTNESVKSYVTAWIKRMRDEIGVKLQTVIYQYAADNLGVISPWNKLVGEASGTESGKIVYWVTGAECACKVNESLTAMVYDGELDVDVNLSQDDLIEAIQNGKFVFHRAGDDVVVLSDINSKVTVTLDEGEDFKRNQTIRVIDQLVNDTAVAWNKYFNGKMPNDASGRISVHTEFVKYRQKLQQMRAIENYVPEDTVVSKGESKVDVVCEDAIEPVNCMEKIYITTVVR